MSASELKELLNRYNSGKCTQEEQSRIESWYLQLDVSPAEMTEAQIAEVMNLQPPAKKIAGTYRFPKWIPAAAAILLLTLAGIFYWQQPDTSRPTTTVLKNDVAPGGNKAILSLSNGQKIALDDVGKGEVTTEKDMLVRKNSDGSIVYSAKDEDQSAADPNIKNTISTPLGGQYRLILSDGTKVWLNAMSSITYPIRFGSKSREVVVTGEVYFEVNHTGSPFYVHSRGQLIEVLGTHFNVNNYADEPAVKTTLLEGSIRVKTPENSLILHPGEQSVNHAGALRTVSADTEAETAWKNGDFMFNGQPLKELMRNIARWYDIRVDYSEYTDRNDTFSGVISRSRNLSAVLKMLEKTKSVKFRIVGKHLYVIN